MVQCLDDDRHAACCQYNLLLSHADILPKEEVIPKSDRRLAKYVEFLDSMIFQPDKKMTLKVINQHATEKVQVFKGMPLTTLLSNPFIKSEFCTVKSILSRTLCMAR